MPQPVVLSGRYVLGSLLGRGGMADVFEAHDSRLGRTVAVKMLRPDMSRDRQLRVRFEREAQAVAALNHPNIVAVYDTGERGADPFNPGSVESPFMVMELVTGRTLRELVRDGSITQERALDYVQGILSALEYSHRAGIVHRDIKPANVMVTDDGTVKVMDFGIARAVADSGATMTQTQAVVGTAQYLSPEQAQGQTVDARSDLYSTGCLLYELLTGRPPFLGDSPVSVVYQHVQVEAPRARDLNPEITEAVQSVLDKALQKDPAKRFQDAGAFRRALRAAGAGRVLPASPANNDAAAAEALALAGAGAGLMGTGRHAAATPADSVDPHLGDTGEIPLVPAADAEAFLPFEEAEDERRPRRRHGGWIALLLLITALVLGGGGYWLYGYLTAPPAVVMITVPNVSNFKDTDAFAKLTQVGFQPEFAQKPSTDVAKGLAIDTIPAAGTQLAKNSKVTIEVSTGPSTAVIPDSVIGNTEAGARDTLRTLGLVPADQSKSANSSTVPLGHVISVDPAPGQTVAIGSQVTLTISTGKVTVPDLRGRLVDDAKAALAGLNLQVQTQDSPSSTAPAGTVIEQSVAPNGSIDQGGTVVLTIAASPSPSPTPSPTSTGKKDAGGGGAALPGLP